MQRYKVNICKRKTLCAPGRGQGEGPNKVAKKSSRKDIFGRHFLKKDFEKMHFQDQFVDFYLDPGKILGASKGGQ